MKPDNFVIVNGSLKVIDFGLAKMLPEGEDVLTFNNPVAGTFIYSPPENFRRYRVLDGSLVEEQDLLEVEEDGVETEIHLSAKADIWSLGVILYLMAFKVGLMIELSPQISVEVINM